MIIAAAALAVAAYCAWEDRHSLAGCIPPGE